MQNEFIMPDIQILQISVVNQHSVSLGDTELPPLGSNLGINELPPV